MSKGMLYVGNGLIWVQNNVPVPNRDLTGDEVEAYGGRAHLLSSGLYVDPPEDDEDVSEENSEVIDDGS